LSPSVNTLSYKHLHPFRCCRCRECRYFCLFKLVIWIIMF